MHKVVINKLYGGGFCLSLGAVKALAKTKGMTKEQFLEINGIHGENIPRHDPDLIALFEEWGSDLVSGWSSELAIQAISDDRYVIVQPLASDGLEQVLTPNNTNWVTIETAPAGAAVLSPNNKPGVAWR